MLTEEQFIQEWLKAPADPNIMSRLTSMMDDNRAAVLYMFDTAHIVCGSHGLNADPKFVGSVIDMAMRGIPVPEIAKKLSTTSVTVASTIKRGLKCGWYRPTESMTTINVRGGLQDEDADVVSDDNTNDKGDGLSSENNVENPPRAKGRKKQTDSVSAGLAAEKHCIVDIEPHVLMQISLLVDTARSLGAVRITNVVWDISGENSVVYETAAGDEYCLSIRQNKGSEVRSE